MEDTACLIGLDLYPQRRVTQSYPVSHGRTEHGGVCITRDGGIHGHLYRSVVLRMFESFLLQFCHDSIRPRHIYNARSQTVAAADDLGPTDVAKRYGLDIAGFEAHRGACCYVEPLAVSLATIEVQSRVRLDEVVVGTNLRQQSVSSVEDRSTDTVGGARSQQSSLLRPRKL